MSLICVGRVAGSVCLAIATLRTGHILAQDWPQWRGPNRDGVAAVEEPKAWPMELKRKWRVEVGEGYASPIVAADRVYCFARRGDEEVLWCLTLADGMPQFQHSYPAPYKVNSVAAAHGAGPKSTPAIGKGCVVTLGIGGILSCRNAVTGNQAWQHDFAQQHKNTSPLYGSAMSPLIEGDVCIAHVGGHDGGAIAAFALNTGNLRWKWEGDGPGYASPLLATIAGQRQVISQTQQNLVGLAVDSGKLLWKLPFKTQYEQNSVSPVLVDSQVLLAGYNQPTALLTLEKQDDQWTTKRTWENSELPMYMNTPVVKGEWLFGMTHRNSGQLFCADAKTGKVLWKGEARLGNNAALVLVGQQLLVLSDNGRLLVVSAQGQKYYETAGYEVSETGAWAHPVPTAKGILIKDQGTLALWSWE